MAKAPDPLNLRADDDVPDWAQKVFTVVNRFADQVQQALSKGITRSENLSGSQKVDAAFTSVASGVDSDVTTVDISNDLNQPPAFVGVNVVGADGTRLTAVWSFSWAMASKGIRISLVGLASSTNYRMTVVYE